MMLDLLANILIKAAAAESDRYPVTARILGLVEGENQSSPTIVAPKPDFVTILEEVDA